MGGKGGRFAQAEGARRGGSPRRCHGSLSALPTGGLGWENKWTSKPCGGSLEGLKERGRGDGGLINKMNPLKLAGSLDTV